MTLSAMKIGLTTPNLRQQMVRLRVLQERLQALCDAGECEADLHLGIGQEAIPVGVCAALGPEDVVLCHHRMIGWAVSKGVPLEPLVAELLGKETGIAGGRAGEMHLRAPEYGLIHTFQLVGTVIPVAAGVAWGMKQRGSKGIVVAVCGDAATANGQFHEGLNIAAVNRLPLLVVVENNGVAGNVTANYYSPFDLNSAVYERARAFDVEIDRVDGNDVDEVCSRVKYAMKRIRETSKPFFFECATNRLGRHKQGMGDLRSKEEMARLWAQDPLRDMTAEERQEAETEVSDLINRVQA